MSVSYHFWRSNSESEKPARSSKEGVSPLNCEGASNAASGDADRELLEVRLGNAKSIYVKVPSPKRNSTTRVASEEKRLRGGEEGREDRDTITLTRTLSSPPSFNTSSAPTSPLTNAAAATKEIESKTTQQDSVREPSPPSIDDGAAHSCDRHQHFPVAFQRRCHDLGNNGKVVCTFEVEKYQGVGELLCPITTQLKQFTERINSRSEVDSKLFNDHTDEMKGRTTAAGAAMHQNYGRFMYKVEGFNGDVHTVVMFLRETYDVGTLRRIEGEGADGNHTLFDAFLAHRLPFIFNRLDVSRTQRPQDDSSDDDDLGLFGSTSSSDF